MTRRRQGILVVACVIAGVTATAGPVGAAAPFRTEASTGPRVAVGRDGAVWFAGGEVVQRLDPATGTISEVAADVSLARDISPGLGTDPVWVAGDLGSTRLVRVTAAGDVEEVPLPANVSSPFAIEPGGDGRMWLLAIEWVSQTEYRSVYGWVDADGTVDLRPAPWDTNSGTLGVGPDGRMWATLPFAGLVVRFDDDVEFASFPVTEPQGPPIAGPDGNIWLLSQSHVVRLDVEGRPVGSPIPAPFGSSANPYFVRHQMAVAEGHVWIAGTDSFGLGGIWRVSPDGSTFAIRGASPPLRLHPTTWWQQPVGCGSAAAACRLPTPDSPTSR